MSKLIRSVLALVFLGWTASVFSADPITNTVTVDGREWAQPDDFTSLSWDDIDSVCSLGPCNGNLTSDSGTYNMAGWFWADFDAMAALFNYYIALHGGGNPFSGGVDHETYQEVDSTWAPAFLTDFTPTGSGRVWGYMREEWPSPIGGFYFGLVASIEDSLAGEWDEASTIANSLLPDSPADPGNGAWFYRPIIIPPTVDLIFSSTTGTGTTGSNTIRAKAGDVLTVDIVVTDHESLGICAASLSLYWGPVKLTGSNAEVCPAPPNIAAGTCNDSNSLSYDPSLPVNQSVGVAEDFISYADCGYGGTTLGFIDESMTLGRTQLFVEVQGTTQIVIGYQPGQGIRIGNFTEMHQPAATATVLPPPSGC